jgi:hypothetical protein
MVVPMTGATDNVLFGILSLLSTLSGLQLEPFDQIIIPSLIPDLDRLDEDGDIRDFRQVIVGDCILFQIGKRISPLIDFGEFLWHGSCEKSEDTHLCLPL